MSRSEITQDDRDLVPPGWEIKAIYQLDTNGRWECEAIGPSSVRVTATGATRVAAVTQLVERVICAHIYGQATPEVAAKDRDERQYQVAKWVERSFSPEVQASVPERVERLYEEVCELAQAEHAQGGLVHHIAKQLVESWNGGANTHITHILLADLQLALEQDRLSTICHQVYQKTPGEPPQEVGGISTTLLAYCDARGMSADSCERDELTRILALPPEHFKARMAAKVTSGMAMEVPSSSPKDDWREDPSADERWTAGCDYAMTQLCNVLGVDSKSVSWDAATETLDGDIQSVQSRILEMWGGEDWRSQGEVHKILSMTDEEIRAQVVAEGRDPDTVAQEVRGKLSEVLEINRRMATAEATVARLSAKLEDLKFCVEVLHPMGPWSLKMSGPLWNWRLSREPVVISTYPSLSGHGVLDWCNYASNNGLAIRVSAARGPVG